MGKQKGDIEIGRRMAQEVCRIFGSPTNATQRLKCGKNSVWEWQTGTTPGGLMLAKLHSFGGDVLYVLTGKREGKGG